MNDTFSPTYLYIKQHTLSGKLYFGNHFDKCKYYLEELNAQ